MKHASHPHALPACCAHQVRRANFTKDRLPLSAAHNNTNPRNSMNPCPICFWLVSASWALGNERPYRKSASCSIKRFFNRSYGEAESQPASAFTRFGLCQPHHCTPAGAIPQSPKRLIALSQSLGVSCSRPRTPRASCRTFVRRRGKEMDAPAPLAESTECLNAAGHYTLGQFTPARPAPRLGQQRRDEHPPLIPRLRPLRLPTEALQRSRLMRTYGSWD